MCGGERGGWTHFASHRFSYPQIRLASATPPPSSSDRYRYQPCMNRSNRGGSTLLSFTYFFLPNVLAAASVNAAGQCGESAQLCAAHGLEVAVLQDDQDLVLCDRVFLLLSADLLEDAACVEALVQGCLAESRVRRHPQNATVRRAGCRAHCP